ncbi:carbohydrate ABC transporter permease [Metabacillus endolithicus]|uniref:Carbohydrate ABC transporter permease n=1 Tax=Metabacillus endolithicus TaxID=1535204 RepID=A0ABW5C3L5_9BACI|nr:carbohydrate ABC transporter permease [Metabacillus endolithicus]UPG62609.1 carbohydrate ABC transporter permease [Metabacillus endolithicus]
MGRNRKIISLVPHIILLTISLAYVCPFLLLIISSITDEKSIIQNGYSFFPEDLSSIAYQYLWNNAAEITHAYGNTILVTVIGTVVGLFMTALLAYPLSRKDLPFRTPLTFIVFFTLLFNGGLVPTYLVYTQLIDIKNTILAQIVPLLLLSGFNVLLMRTFFISSIPDSVIESAKIDGASEVRIFFSIVLPLSLPILATIGLFQATSYWNDWFNQMVYITDPDLFTIQNVLNRILTDTQFLSSTSLGASANEANAQIPGTTIRMAIAVIGILPMLLAYPFFQKYFVKGITVGAVKG